jgi:hypothetical protein
MWTHDAVALVAEIVTNRDTPHIIRKRPEATPAYIADW